MRISEEFPSKYLKSSDLKGREVRVTMSHVDREEIGTDKKLVLYFEGKEKGMVLNKTNANTIGDFYGDDSDDWRGEPLILFAIKTEYQGKPVDGLRCRIPTAKDNKPAAQTQRANGNGSHDPRSYGPDDPISSGVPKRPVGGISDNLPAGGDDIPF